MLALAFLQASPPLPRAAGVGWAFHFLIGGGGVAGRHPAVLLFGLATSVLPWFVLRPAFGWGWFGRRGPRGAYALLASPFSHMPCGLGIGAVMAVGSVFL